MEYTRTHFFHYSTLYVLFSYWYYQHRFSTTPWAPLRSGLITEQTAEGTNEAHICWGKGYMLTTEHSILGHNHPDHLNSIVGEINTVDSCTYLLYPHTFGITPWFMTESSPQRPISLRVPQCQSDLDDPWGLSGDFRVCSNTGASVGGFRHISMVMFVSWTEHQVVFMAHDGALRGMQESYLFLV